MNPMNEFVVDQTIIGSCCNTRCFAIMLCLFLFLALPLLYTRSVCLSSRLVLNLGVFKRTLLLLPLPLTTPPIPTPRPPTPSNPSRASTTTPSTTPAAAAAATAIPCRGQILRQHAPLLQPGRHVLAHLRPRVVRSGGGGPQEAVPRACVQPQGLVQGLGPLVELPGGLRVVQGVLVALEDEEGGGLLCFLYVFWRRRWCRALEREEEGG